MVYELKNPVTKTLITNLRDQRTDAIRFRHTIAELTKQLVYEALQEFPLVEKTVTTWQGENSFTSLDEKNIIVATVLRAGMPMLDSVMELLPNVTAGFLAMKRDEVTHKSKLYYDRLPDCKGTRARRQVHMHLHLRIRGEEGRDIRLFPRERADPEASPGPSVPQGFGAGKIRPCAGKVRGASRIPPRYGA